MSQPVELPALRSRLEEYGSSAFLTTVGDEASPHVTSVTVRMDGDRLVFGAGRTSRANLEARPTVALLWPAPAGADYSLIVDGTFDGPVGDAGDVALRPTSAILHRVAGTPGDGATCLPVTEP
jgi:hypothetical protein